MDGIRKKNSTSLLYLFRTFLIIGASSFGGYTALISFVQKRLVERDHLISEEEILDGVTVASLLPGPLAVNVVAYIGFKLKGWVGALISMMAVLLPSMILMIISAELYLQFGSLNPVQSVISGILLAICGLIAMVVFNMSKKTVKQPWQVILVVTAFCVLFLLQGYWVIIVLLVTGGLTGLILGKAKSSENQQVDAKTFPWLGALLIVLTVGFSVWVWKDPLLNQLLLVFTQVSLTLFGGGYVMIPVLFDLVVDQQEWLTAEAFSLAISLGQMTPGPILVSATYVGYVVNGIAGACTATAAIFLPSAILMVLLSDRLETLKSSAVANKILMGIRPVIVGMIAYSIVLIFMSQDFSLIRLALAIVAAVLFIFARINDILLILVFGCLGFFLF